MVREQTGVELAFGGETRAAAGCAKGLRHGGDEANFAAAVVETPALRHLAAVVLRHGVHGPAFIDARRQFAGGHHHVRPPVIAIADVHKFDETHDHGCAAKVFDEIKRGVVVYASLDDGVDLNRRQSRGDGGVNACEHLIERAESAAQARKNVLVQAVQAHGDAPQAIGVQIDRMIGQQHSVGGQGEVLDSRDAGQVADQISQVGAQQRLTAGEAHLLHAQARK